MPPSHADSRCLCCGHLCVAPAPNESFRCGRCWTVVKAGTCPQGHGIAWPVFNPQAPCIYCSGRVLMDEPQSAGASRLRGHQPR